MQHQRIVEILRKIGQRRQEAGLSRADLEERLILGSGWMELVESGKVEPPLSMLLAVLGELKMSLTDLMASFSDAEPLALLNRPLQAYETTSGVRFEFQYGQHASQIEIPGASIATYDSMLKLMRSAFQEHRPGAASASASIVDAFLFLVQSWPKANPSDLWYFLLPRAFSDPFNHPAVEYGKNWDQSWKRTSGWALENVFLRHYSAHLALNSIRLEAPAAARKRELLGGLGLGNQVNPDKADILLIGANRDESERCFGVVHVKASFAERRTDDVPLSAALLARGYVSPLVTMDCKGHPGEFAWNGGELGPVLSPDGDSRSAKRLDFEVHRHFDACFSYNQNTAATPDGQQAAARIHVCDFHDPDDEFSRHVIAGWHRLTGRR